MKINVKIKNVLQNNLIYIIFVGFMIIKSIIFHQMLELKTSFSMIICLLGIPMLILLPALFIRKNYNKILYCQVIYSLISIILYGNYLYYQYATSFLSFYQIENLQYTEEIGMGLGYLIHISDLLIFFGDIIIVILLLVYNRRIRIQNKLIEKEKISFKIFFSIIVIGIVGIQIHYQIDIQYQEYIYNKTMMVEHIGIYYYHIEDAKEFLIETLWKEIANKERMKWIYDAKIQQKSQVTEYTGSQQGKNIIIVQLESLNEFVINKQINGMEITPNLNRFYQENIYCSDMYNQGLGTTADSEHTVATSLYPLENGRVFQKYFRNQWNSLYQEVKKEGYYTSFMHPNVNTFWNRYEVYKGGYKVDQYEDITQFQTNGEMAGEFFSDEQFLTQSINKMRQYKEPFCTMLVAISTHTPYSLDGIQDIECKVTINTEGLESEELEKYLKSCNFVDYSFGRFMEELEKTELLKNSIVVVYGDHGAGVQDTKAIQKLYEQNRQPYNSSIERLENVHVPFGLKIPNWNGIKRIDKTVSKLDVKPTILDLLGIQDTISLGKSIFIAQDSSFIKGIGFVTSENYYIDGEYIDRQANAVRLKDDKLEELTEQMEQEFYFSDTLIRNNLLK